jgi:hypothetical protein
MLRAVPLVCAIAMLAFAACADRIQPAGSTLVKDVPPPPPPPDDQDADQPPPYDAGIPDGYTPVDANYKACAGCVCAPSSSYCFAGASPRAPGDAGGDGGPVTCTTASSSPPQVGCNTIPSACTATPNCACIIDFLQPLYRCYLNCRNDGDGMLVYCPTP